MPNFKGAINADTIGMDNKYAIVTGASSGIGKCIAIELAARNYPLILVARRKKLLENLKEELTKKYSIDVQCMPFDLSKKEAPSQLFREVITRNYTIDILVNNAGFGLFGPFVSSEQERVNEMIQVNINTLTNLTMLFSKEMIERKRGRILLVSSIVAFQALPNYAAYAASKSYVSFLGKALQYELRNSEVSLTILVPGSTKTNFQKTSGYQPSKIAEKSASTPQEVAQKGVAGLLKGKRVVVVGLSNRILRLVAKILPSKLMISLSGRMMN